MLIEVEPRDGDDLDRLITAILNITGIVRNLVEETFDAHPKEDRGGDHRARGRASYAARSRRSASTTRMRSSRPWLGSWPTRRSLAANEDAMRVYMRDPIPPD